MIADVADCDVCAADDVARRCRACPLLDGQWRKEAVALTTAWLWDYQTCGSRYSFISFFHRIYTHDVFACLFVASCPGNGQVYFMGGSVFRMILCCYSETVDVGQLCCFSLWQYTDPGPVSPSIPPHWPSGKASASRVEDPGFESRLRWDFFGVESYQ